MIMETSLSPEGIDKKEGTAAIEKSGPVTVTVRVVKCEIVV